MDGFMRNGWYLGFLNLYETSIQSNLAEAIKAMYQYVRIDTDIPFDLNHLKNRILQEFDHIRTMGINAIAVALSGKRYNITPHINNYLVELLGGVLGIRPITQLPAYDIYLNSLPISQSLQEALDLFHTNITPSIFVNHFKSMLKDNKLEIINPDTGINFIWEVISIPAKNRLRNEGIPENDINEHLFTIDGELKQDFIILLFLKELGFLKEINCCPSHNMILD
jgi:hypothetical protein